MGHASHSPVDTKPRVLVVEGTELTRRGICDVLRSDQNAVVVGEVERLEELRHAYREFRPDIVFLGGAAQDVDEKAGNRSMAALRQTIRLVPKARVIVLLENPGAAELVEIVQQGASGILPHDASARSLLEAVRDVLEGGTVIDPQLFRRLFEQLAQMNDSATRAERGLQPAVMRLLSPREQEVLAAVAQGKRNKEIAAELGVSVGTVKTHLRHIFRKLTVDDRVAAILAALHMRLPEAL